ncbi:MAG TPA: hypothetical protein VED63_00265 [Acidimicrobiales bacterium]|nr:hypothetical protein [Acidimicrobiales bacterium]
MEGVFRYRVAAVPALPGDNDEGDGGSDARNTTEAGWELVRARPTKDGVSTLLLYRRPA